LCYFRVTGAFLIYILCFNQRKFQCILCVFQLCFLKLINSTCALVTSAIYYSLRVSVYVHATQREGTGMGLHKLDLSAGSGRVGSTTHQPLYSQERDPIPTVQVAEWALGLAWIPHGGLNLRPSSPQ
jgi:hypothetical protein